MWLSILGTLHTFSGKNNLYRKFEYMFQVHQTLSTIHTVRKNDMLKYRIQRKTSLENARQEK